ncbi:hypothetical protein Q5530_00955 [Saccharothrix sp. BKS2]|uniref:hypothetical protein n=1 Tax=Saccharothrix sp. BKS2 TaxID=3064400 RepID=UPI0039EB15B6
MLDDHAAGYPDPAHLEDAHLEDAHLEDAVEVAASLVAVAVAEGHPVRLLSSSGAVDVELPAGAVDADAAVVLTALADLTAVAGEPVARSVPVRDLDVVEVVCGASSDLSASALEAGRASVGVVLVVDPGAGRAVSAIGSVPVLRAAAAEGLLDAWNAVVSR